MQPSGGVLSGRGRFNKKRPAAGWRVSHPRFADHLTMRRFDSSSAISLKLSDSVAPVAFQNSLAGLVGSVGSLRKRESEEHAFSASIAFLSPVLVVDRSSA